LTIRLVLTSPIKTKVMCDRVIAKKHINQLPARWRA
jgi:hypothetical protein